MLNCDRPIYARASLACILLLTCSSSNACTQIIMGGKGMAYEQEVLSSRNMGFYGSAKLRVRSTGMHDAWHGCLDACKPVLDRGR